MRVGVATIQRGRLEHLGRQIAATARSGRAPTRSLVVSMDAPGDERARETVARSSPGAPADLVRLPVPDGTPLPLAEARNAAVDALSDLDLVVLLDVDCIPGPDLVGRYADAAARRDGLLSGPVGHLPAGRPVGVLMDDDDRRSATVRGARPVPADGTLRDEPRHELFWSLSFAVAPAVHARIGGFDEGYRGYGGEDTDYAFRARRAGVGLTWVGGAWAYHQHHPVSSPPREHLRDIVPNARRFRDLWGRWPMEGWLAAFAAEGLVDWDPTGDRLVLVDASARAGTGSATPVPGARAPGRAP